MSVYSPVYHTMVSSPARAEPAAAPADKPADQDEGFFHHLLDVINPLQHLPVIGTIYRAITGDHIGTIEKIAGDALYGGLWGAVASIADVAFEAVTGKSVEDTALAWFHDDKAKVAKVAAPVITADASLPASGLPALPVAMDLSDSSSALASALSAKGVDNETASRALYAYRRSMSLSAPVFASVN